MSDLALPPGLIAAIRDHRVVLFLGAGASLEASTKDGKRPPTANGLRDTICDKFFGGEYKEYDLASAGEFAIDQHGSIVFNEFIRNIFASFQPSSAHEAITKFKWAALATTNYDQLIEDAYEASPSRLQNPIPFISDRDPIETRLRGISDPVELIKLHGCVSRASDAGVPLILSTSSYDEFGVNRSRLFGRLEEKAYEHPFIFCGYRIADSHIRRSYARKLVTA